MDIKANYKIGILGGMGPLASSLLYEKITKLKKANKDQDHIDLVILSHATMPDRTKAILNNEVDELIKIFLEDIKKFECLGVKTLAIPCNSSHVLIEELSKHTKIKILNMIELTAKYLKENVHINLDDFFNQNANSNEKMLKPPSVAASDFGEKIGILATTGTVKIGLYNKNLEKEGYLPINLDKTHQEIIMDIIYNEVKNGGKINLEKFNKCKEYLIKKGARRIILACTELSVIKEQFALDDFYIDPLIILAQRIIQESKI